MGGPRKIFDAFQANSVQLIGVSAGSFDERYRFVREYARLLNRPVSDQKVPYVYLDEWAGDQCVAALDEGFRLALHPHMYKEIQTLREAEELLAKFEKLWFLPDTGHLYIAGDDPAAAIERQARRIEAVHLKDWQQNVGRSYQFYARGFCELGKGDIKLEPVLDKLVRKARHVWLIVEQDCTSDPVKSGNESLQWLRDRLGQRVFD